MLKNYIKIALKVLTRRKFFTFVNLFGTSFTLIVLMTVTGLFDHILHPVGPEKNSDELLLVHRLLMRSPDRRSSTSGDPGYLYLDRYVRTLESAERVSIFTTTGVGLSFLDGKKIVSQLKRTDGEYWEILDFKYLEGGPITAQNESRGDFVAVINEATRETFFDSEPALGKTITVNSQNFQVVGVVENVGVFEQSAYADIWVPISTSKTSEYRERYRSGFNALVQVSSAEQTAKVKEEYRSVLDRIEFPNPERYNYAMSNIDTTLERIARGFFDDEDEFEASTGKFLATLLSLALLFMLLPTINLININVSRILERSSEIGIRKAFGASSRSLIGQFVTENVILTALAGVIGFVGSTLLLHALSQSGLVPYAQFHVNVRVFFYGLLTILFFGVFSGVYPAWKMSRLHPVDALRGKV